MRVIGRFLRGLIIAIFIILLIAILFFYGWGLYEYYSATKDNYLVDQVTQIQESDNFVDSDNISNYFFIALTYDIDPNYENAPSVNLLGFVQDLYQTVTQKEQITSHDTITLKTAHTILYQNNYSIGKRLSSAFAANTLQSQYDKAQILTLLANTLYFGNNKYGIYDASKYYFDKEPQDLSLDEASLLYVISKDPDSLSPTKDYEATKQAQFELLDKLSVYTDISQSDIDLIKSDVYATNIRGNSNYVE